jgi:UTP--glucose-1-phosphate uridylyltransferase
LDELIEKEDRSVCFMSNIDNMGATVDLSILKEFIEEQSEFIMEVTYLNIIY